MRARLEVTSREGILRRINAITSNVIKIARRRFNMCIGISPVDLMHAPKPRADPAVAPPSARSMSPAVVVPLELVTVPALRGSTANPDKVKKQQRKQQRQVQEEQRRQATLRKEQERQQKEEVRHIEEATKLCSEGSKTTMTKSVAMNQ